MNTITIENGFVNGIFDIPSSITASDAQKALGNKGSAKFTLRVKFENIPLERIMHRAASSTRISHQNSGLRDMSEAAINALNGTVQEYTESKETRKVEAGPVKQLDALAKRYIKGEITIDEFQRQAETLKDLIK